MFFDCKITLSIKEPGTQFCPVPECPDPPRRLKRQQQYLIANNSNNFILNHKNEEEKEFCKNNNNILIYLTLFPLDLSLIIVAILLIFDGFKQFNN